jgi:hypothetical protein
MSVVNVASWETADTAPGIGHEHRLARQKYATVGEYLAELRVINAEAGIRLCPIEAYLAEHVDDDVIPTIQHVIEHPEWGPMYLAGAIRDTTRFNNAETDPEHGDELAAIVQHDCALALVKHPWGARRAVTERLLRDERTRFVDGRAPYVLLADFHENHRNPRPFFERFPAAAAKFPGAEFDRFKALDFDREPQA